MIRDDHVHDHVDDYLHDLLSPEDADRVEHHCAGCASCRAALEQARRRQSVMESVPAVEAPQPLVHATLDRIDARELSRRRFRRRFLLAVPLAAVAAALLIAACHFYFYNLTVSPNDLQVLGQTTLLAGSSGSLRVRLLDRQTGRPLPGVPVAVEMRRQGDKDFVELAQFQTDANGTGEPRFNLADWDEGKVELRITARTEGKAEVLTQPLTLKRSWKLMLSTDKPVYQPGQTILVRGLALGKPDLKPVPGQAMAFIVTDPKGNVLFKHRPSTSKFGIASAECPLATELIEGPYQVACKLGDTESKVTVQVKKYVLPKFKIDVTLDKPYYTPGDRVRATVQADYFFGKPVAGGEVLAEVQANEIGPRALGNARSRTDDKGRAVFEFSLPRQLVGRPQDSGDARIAVAVQVTDTAGQKQARSVSRVVTSNPLRVEVIPEAGALVQDVKNTVYLYASYADGRPAAKASVEVTGVEKKLTTNDLGVASFEMTPNQSRVVLTVGAKDDKGVAGVRKVWLECGQVGNDFLLRTDKAVYKGGDTVKLVALGGGVEPVFVDLIKDGQTILTDTIDVQSGKGEHHIDLPADLFGTVELCAYRFSGQGLAVRKTRALFIRRASRLDLKAKLDQKEYRPGGKAKLALTLTDPKGKPAPGAISLAGVDEAVFRVLEQRPGLEARFFALEQELLKPVYTIYPSWDPDTDNDLPIAERDRFEQALFARTWQTVRQPAFGDKAAGGMAMNEPMFAPAPPPMVAGGIRREAPQAAPVREASPHSLAAESFPIKEREVKEMRRSGLKGVTIAWVALGLSILLAGYVALWLFVPKWLVAVLHGVAALVVLPLACLVLPLAYYLTARSGARMEMAAGRATMDGALMEPMAQMNAPQERMPLPPPGGAAPAVRVREEFPETLLWRPEIITDDEGRASLDIDLADSITTWRLTASAVTADGRLGATQAGLRVFQPFFVDLNLPVALTRNDEVSVPVVVYNYLKEPQTVELKLEVAGWFELTGDPVQKIELAANEVRSLSYRLRVKKVGNHTLQVTARGGDLADAIKRNIEVVPDGRRVEEVVNGNLQKPVEIKLTVPEDAIEGSPKAFLKVYPSGFSQLVEGLDGIFQMPHGCFEQTSSTTYPNVLALDYLRTTHKAAPEVEAKARQYIHLGYQRLVSFEVSGGGFDWFGRPPANRRLTAYGLMEFEDMAKVHDVDPNLIRRTRDWLLKQRKSDGSWEEAPGLHAEADPARGQRGDLARYVTTAYIAWAVFNGQSSDSRARQTLDYLLSTKPDQIGDPYVLALACNALLALDPDGKEAKPYLERLEELKKTSEDGKQCWWEMRPGERTCFYGAGQSGSVETTALATLALLHAKQSPGTTRAALAWIVARKDARGTWQSTQATVYALKALLAGMNTGGEEKDRVIELTLGDGHKQTVRIPKDQAEVMKLIDLSQHLKPGQQLLAVKELSDTAANFQVAFRYHVPGEKLAKNEPLSVRIDYDRTDLRVGETVTARATVANRTNGIAPMVMLDLPIPAGFAVNPDDLANAVAQGQIARYQVTARQVIVYVRGLQPGAKLELRYTLRATMPVRVTVPAARAYEYYDPDKQGRGRTVQMTVKGRE